MLLAALLHVLMTPHSNRFKASILGFAEIEIFMALAMNTMEQMSDHKSHFFFANSPDKLVRPFCIMSLCAEGTFTVYEIPLKKSHFWMVIFILEINIFIIIWAKWKFNSIFLLGKKMRLFERFSNYVSLWCAKWADTNTITKPESLDSRHCLCPALVKKKRDNDRRIVTFLTPRNKIGRSL